MNSSFSHKKSPKIFRNLRLINPDKKVVYCKKCVLSNQRPRTMFNEEGICAPCLYAEFKKTGIDWDKREKGEPYLLKYIKGASVRWLVKGFGS